jgi:hypothetical protein
MGKDSNPPVQMLQTLNPTVHRDGIYFSRRLD